LANIKKEQNAQVCLATRSNQHTMKQDH